MSPSNPAASTVKKGDPAKLPGSIKPAGEQWLDVGAAASLLFMRRAYVEKLVADGLLGTVRSADGRVLVLDSAVKSYKMRLKRTEKRGLLKMVAASVRMRLYTEEYEAVAHLRRESKSTPENRK